MGDGLERLGHPSVGADMTSLDMEHRLQRVQRAIAAQKIFMFRVQDPDNRTLAEINLLTLVGMKHELERERARLGLAR